MDFNTILQAFTAVVVAVLGYLFARFKDGVDTAVKTSAEEGVKATMKEITWPADLAKELQKTRGVARQELRYKSYAKLWSQLRPLAIYDSTLINKESIENLSLDLSNWYFSEDGGLLLTPQARDFYFALQDLLRTVAKTPREWYADRSEETQGDLKKEFIALLTDLQIQDAVEVIQALDEFSTAKRKGWQDQAPDLGDKWRTAIKKVVTCWDEVNDRQRFVIIQQVGSILRTSLTTDLDSRLL